MLKETLKEVQRGYLTCFKICGTLMGYLYFKNKLLMLYIMTGYGRDHHIHWLIYIFCIRLLVFTIDAKRRKGGNMAIKMLLLNFGSHPTDGIGPNLFHLRLTRLNLSGIYLGEPSTRPPSYTTTGLFCILAFYLVGKPVFTLLEV